MYFQCHSKNTNNTDLAETWCRPSIFWDMHYEDNTPDGFRDMLIPLVRTPHISEAMRSIILIFEVNVYHIRYYRAAPSF